MKRRKTSVTIDPPDIGDLSRLEVVRTGEALKGQRYSDCAFEDADFSGQQVSQLSFSSVVLRKVKLAKTKWRGVSLTDVMMREADFSLADWVGATFVRVEISAGRGSGLNASEAQLREVVIQGCALPYAVFQFAKLERCRFEDCDLTDATFQGASLRHVMLKNCQLRNAQFTEARIESLDLRGSKLEGTNLDLGGLKEVVIDPGQTEAIAMLTGVQIRALEG